MSLDKIVEDIKKRPGFTENVGMIMLHNGVVRGFSRNGHKKVASIQVYANELKIGEICQEVGSRKGIFAVTAEASQGLLKPGDNLLLLAVAGDIRENVIPAFEELLHRVKKDAVEKQEFFED